MLDYGDLETELSEKLNAYFRQYDIDPFFKAKPIPQNESEFSEDLDIGQIWVKYESSAIDTSGSIREVSQQENITIRFIFRTQSLRQDDGYYRLVRHAKLCLLGYTPHHCCKKMAITKFDLVEYENLGFVHIMDMQTATILVQQFDDEDIAAGDFKRANFL